MIPDGLSKRVPILASLHPDILTTLAETTCLKPYRLRVWRTTDLLADVTLLALVTRIANRFCESAGIMPDGSAAVADIQTHQEALAEAA